LGQDGDWRETGTRAFADLQGGLIVNALPKVEASAERIDQDLTAVGRGLVGVGQLEVKFGLSFGKSRHGSTSP
jgi:hypothetical protein